MTLARLNHWTASGDFGPQRSLRRSAPDRRYGVAIHGRSKSRGDLQFAERCTRPAGWQPKYSRLGQYYDGLRIRVRRSRYDMGRNCEQPNREGDPEHGECQVLHRAPPSGWTTGLVGRLLRVRKLLVATRVLGSAPDAEDITGDVFLGMPVALRSYSHTSGCGLRRWLERITVRLASARANCLAATREIPLDSVRPPASWPEHPIDRLALDRALATLTPALRSVFLLKAVEGYSHQEISAMLDIGVGASRVRLHRARRELHATLGDGN